MLSICWIVPRCRSRCARSPGPPDRPNTAARDLREGRSRTVGALLNDLRHPWFVELLDGLTDELAEQGRQLLLTGGRLDRARDDAMPRTFADLDVGGLVLVGTQAAPPALAEVPQLIPTVAVAWRDLDLPRVDTVGNDDLAGARWPPATCSNSATGASPTSGSPASTAAGPTWAGWPPPPSPTGSTIPPRPRACSCSARPSRSGGPAGPSPPRPGYDVPPVHSPCDRRLIRK